MQLACTISGVTTYFFLFSSALLLALTTWTYFSLSRQKKKLVEWAEEVEHRANSLFEDVVGFYKRAKKDGVVPKGYRPPLRRIDSLFPKKVR